MRTLRSSARLAGFDGLRAVAALSVFGYHVAYFSDQRAFANASPSWLLGMAQQLRAGVWIFFVLSGMLLYRGWAATHLDDAPTPDVAGYARHRLLRVFPAYWFALLFFLAIHRTLLTPQSGLATAFRQFSLTQIYAKVIDTFSGLPHTWSLAVEISFYLCLPLYAATMAWLGRKLGPARRLHAEVIGIAALVGFWLIFTIATRGDGVRQQWLPNFMMAFGAGIAIAVFSTDAAANTAVRRWGATIATHPGRSWASAFAVLIVRSRLGITHENGFESQIFYTSAALLLVAPFAFVPPDTSGSHADENRDTLSARSRPARAPHRLGLVDALDSAPMRFLGRISYGIFLWHYLLIVIVRVDWLDVRDGSVNPIKLGLLSVLPTLAIATASWYIVERPTLRVAQRGSLQFGPALVLITASGGAWRVFYVLVNRGRLRINGDAAYYFYQAQAIAKGAGFVDPFQWRNSGGRVVAESAGHPPTFLLYLAGLIKVGVTSETGLRLATCVLGTAMVCIIGLAAREVARNVADAPFADRVGLLAAAGGAVYANLWINDEMLMSESMAALATALCVLTIARFRNVPSLRRSIELAMAVGFAAMSRAELLALAVIVMVPLILRRREVQLKARVQWLSLSAVVVVVIIAPWIGYNLTRFHHPVLMSNGIGGVTLNGNCSTTYRGALVGYWYVGCGSELAKLYQHDPEIRETCLLTDVSAAFEPGKDLRGDESDREACWRALGLKYIAEHKSQFPKVALARVARTWEVFRVEQGIGLNGGLEGRGLDPSRLGNRQYYMLMACAIGGLVVLRRRRVMLWPFLGFAALASFTAVTSFGITRYRIPVDVILPILAAIGVSTFWSRLRSPAL